MPMFEVDPAEVETILALQVPRHPKARFDDAEFRELIARSFSIDLEEKKALLMSAGKMDQASADSLLRVLRQEQAGFADINQHAEKARRGKLRLVK
jgi:hypothetical protein